MLIRLQPEHIEPCADLYTEVFTQAPWFYDWITRAKAVRYIGDLFVTPGFWGFAFASERGWMGMCLGCVIDYFNAPQYDIKEILVAPAAQGQGVGTRMLGAIEACLREEGVVCVTLQTASNIPAYGFYRKNGYAHCQQNVHLYKFL